MRLESWDLRTSRPARLLHPCDDMKPFWKKRWPWVVLTCLLVVGALLLLAQDQETLRVRSPVEASAPEFVEYLSSLVGAPVTSGDSYQVLQNGDAFYPPMLAAIENAKRRIVFESFIFSDGTVSARFVDALSAAARRGVEVRVVLDAIGASDLPDERVKAMEDAGVQVRWFNPLHPWQLEETNYRTHRKVIVVDGQVAFIGGAGLADHWQGDARNPEEWRDTQFRIRGPAVHLLEACFYENWIESGGYSMPLLEPEPPSEKGPATSITLWSNSTGGASNVKLLYLLAIAGARRTVDLQSPYLLLDGSTRFVLDEARARGVRVRLLTEGDQTDAPAVKYASRGQYQSLLDGGVELYEYQPTMMHAKVMVVDGHLSIIGSANFDNRSLELNDEQTSAVFDTALADALVAAFERDLERSRRLSADEWRRRPLLEKSREKFWGLFGELF
jgi:cardiolipin synthase